ncbi:MAG: helix-turn-helix transcriptional regulator [bacterium]
MDDIRTIFQVVRDARCAKSMTQSQLAEAVGCKQSAVSMFESGRIDVLSQKTLTAIAEQLGLDVKSLSGMDVRPLTARSLVLKCCTIDSCPSNIPFTVQGRVRYAPAMVEASAAEQTRCAMCGDVMEDHCPNTDCQAELVEGAFCQRCGTAYVPAACEERDNAEQWAETARARISELMSMAQTKHFVRRATRAVIPGDGHNLRKQGGGVHDVEKRK